MNRHERLVLRNPTAQDKSETQRDKASYYRRPTGSGYQQHGEGTTPPWWWSEGHFHTKESTTYFLASKTNCTLHSVHCTHKATPHIATARGQHLSTQHVVLVSERNYEGGFGAILAERQEGGCKVVPYWASQSVMTHVVNNVVITLG